MSALFPYLTEIHHLRNQVAADSANLKHMRLAPLNTFPRMQIRQLELGLDSRKSRLRFLEAAERKFNANQPRVPAGHSDGGQWTNGNGGSSLPHDQNVKPMKVDFSGVRPRADTHQPIKPMPDFRSGRQTGRSGGPAIAAEILRQLPDTDPLNSSFRGTTQEALDRYNWLLQNAPKSIVPALHFTPHEFKPGEGPKLEKVVVPMLREQVEGACPLYKAVQTQVNLAARAAGKISDYRSAAEFGTRMHTILKDNIVRNYNGRLIPERSFLKYAEELSENNYGENGVRYGLPASLRLDILEKVKNGVVCVYDLKAGKKGLTPARMVEIGQSVQKNFSGPYRIFIIPIQPELDY